MKGLLFRELKIYCDECLRELLFRELLGFEDIRMKLYINF